MAEFRLERFKYNWKGNWTAGVSYKRDDVVRVNGKSYVCIITHVSSNAFTTDLTAILPGSNPPLPQPKWTVMTNGVEYVGNYTVGTDYNLGDVVLNGGVLWLCVLGHTSTGAVEENDNWEIFADSINFIGDWNTGILYGPGSIVKYNGINYKCNTMHTSGQTLEEDQPYWETVFEGVEFRGSWESDIEYRKNDFVKYGGSIYRCTETHTSSISFDNNKFNAEVFGSQFEGTWNEEVQYNIGDVVFYEGFSYYAITNNIGSRPYADSGSTDWVLLYRGYNFLGNWDINGRYKTGDVVLRGGNLYHALRDIGNETEIDPLTFEEIPVTNFNDGSSVDYLDPDTWELLVPGKSWKGNWTVGTLYSVGDIVYWKGSSYSCNFEHEAAIANYPGDNGNGYYYWDILFQAGREGGLREKGDILTYGLSREIEYDGSTVGDGSTLGDVRLQIGNQGQLLSVNDDLEVFWRDITEDAESVFVSTNGIDAEGRGTFQQPFKTIRYAAEYVEDNYTPLTPVIIRVSAGKFEEIGPIIVPAGCAVNGDELRSTTVLANGPLTEYQGDYTYWSAYINHFISILLAILEGTEITPQEGNTESQIKLELIPSLDDNGNQFIDQDGNLVFEPNDYPTSDLDAANTILDYINTFKNYVEFRIADGTTDPVMSGSNELNSDQNLLNALQGLALNKKFLEQEVVNFLRNEYPNFVFNEQRIINDFQSLIRGITRDITYSGNYATIQAARRYANAVTGSKNDSIFFLRDSTGVRDLTTGGLTGALNPPGVFDLYQKPTGGNCVSLDPGWGPDDNRTWIINRSPYIQGVTNTGDNCVGMKIDGSLHNGGNRSMVANDFTQVLSDGIGAWVLNNARAELVSVFTYYCQIGYLAEDGGVIRSTNGNNSYGTYGSIADGKDDTEIPQTVTLFNRNNEASVLEAFAGGTADEFFIFQYGNAGQEYNTATATITGAGENASVEFDDYRDNAIFQARLTSPDGSSDTGGGGYLIRRGTAQETLGASSTLILSQNDITQQLSEVLGMRIIITNGTGVGQYGYIDDFDFPTKTVTVRRDSDGELGWDHVIPGTPIATNLDLTTNYQIEPRVTVDAPSFTLNSYDLFTNRTYVDSIFGNFTQTYTNVSAGADVLWRDDNNERISVLEIISDIQIKFTAYFADNPNTPFTIRGRTTGTVAEVTAISGNVDNTLEVSIDQNGNSFEVGEEIDLVLVSGTGDTFDGAPTAAVFNIVRKGIEYDVTLVSGGAGYEPGNVITIPGTALGGTTPDNDLLITVATTSEDSTNAILTFTSSGTGRQGRFIALTDAEYVRYSDDGQSWTEVSLPFTGSYQKLVSGNNKFLAIASSENRISSSLNGVLWTEVALPLSAAWTDGVYGNGKFIIVGGDSVISSEDGTTWTQRSIPDDTDGGLDSTQSVWNRVDYGKGIYLAVSGSDLATATSTDGINWTRHDSALTPFVGEADTDYSLSYGNNRFVIVRSDGLTAYSFDGITWYSGNNMPAFGGVWVDTKYSQGLFFAIAQNNPGATDVAATSEDGILWTQRTLSSPELWSAITHGNVNGTSKWVILASAASTGAVNHALTGAQAKLRATYAVGSISNIKIWDPGSGYDSENPPTISFVDPNVTSDATAEARLGNKVLAQPSFINRGSGYRSASSTITITGDGFADVIPEASELTVSGVVTVPGPGVQIEITGVPNLVTEDPDDLFIFSGVEVFDLGDDGSGNETRLVKFTVSPRLEPYLNLQHGTTATLRERYSQCRISGHDFLDIGTGNFEETNYPEIYAGGRFFTALPQNEVYEANSGRVFYVSTDQDGNFRTGELFSVQQATGIVTISAQFFDLDGLSELSLGGVRLGGSGTVVNEFSTDPTFSADSNNVVPTQRAIATFLADRLSVGGESLEVNRLQAGRVILGGEENEVDNSNDEYLIIPSDVNFSGSYTANDGEGNITTELSGVSGTILTQSFIFKIFDDTMQ